MANGRRAELTGVVRPDVDEGALDRNVKRKVQRGLSEATEEGLSTGIDAATNTIQRKFERAIPGGAVLGSVFDAVRGGGGGAGGGAAGGGGDPMAIQQAQLEKLDDIEDAIERSGVTAGGSVASRVLPGGRGGGSSIGGGAIGFLLGGGAALGGTPPFFPGIFGKGGAKGPDEKFLDDPVSNAIQGAMQDAVDGVDLPEFPEPPDLSGLDWPEFPEPPDLSGLSWPTFEAPAWVQRLFDIDLGGGSGGGGTGIDPSRLEPGTRVSGGLEGGQNQHLGFDPSGQFGVSERELQGIQNRAKQRRGANFDIDIRPPQVNIRNIQQDLERALQDFQSDVIDQVLEQVRRELPSL